MQKKPFYENNSKTKSRRNVYIIKAICDKPVANIILHGEKLRSFPLKSEMRQGFHSPLSYSV
jgi:hypothetical protein